MKRKFDIQGHRGCRGLFPENTLPGFLYAAKLGVTTLELDVVISKDKQVVISHEPWMNPEICFTNKGQSVEGNGMQHNLYEMTYDEIMKFDCGMNGHPRFEKQYKIPSIKPLLTELIDAVEYFVKVNGRPEVFYNIETKCLPVGDNIFHPPAGEFALLLYDVLKSKNVLHRSIIQSFDYRTLEFIKRHDDSVKLAMLVESRYSIIEKLNELSFVPDIYSPHFHGVDETLVEKCRDLNMKLIPWTVNNPDEMQRLYAIGADGLITDYPDVALSILKD